MVLIRDTLTQMQNDSNRLYYERGRETVGSDKLDKSAFLQLMLAQLQYQDPTEPTDNSQFIQQQAVFTQTETLQDLNKTLTLTSQISQASGMVGKNVEVAYYENNASEPKYKTGTVDSILISGGQVGLRLGETVYGLNQVTRIFAGAIPTETPAPAPSGSTGGGT